MHWCYTNHNCITEYFLAKMMRAGKTHRQPLCQASEIDQRDTPRSSHRPSGSLPWQQFSGLLSPWQHVLLVAFEPLYRAALPLPASDARAPQTPSVLPRPELVVLPGPGNIKPTTPKKTSSSPENFQDWAAQKIKWGRKPHGRLCPDNNLHYSKKDMIANTP